MNYFLYQYIHFCYCWSVDEDTTLLLISKNAFCYKTLDQSLNRLGAPAACLYELFSNFICADGCILPYNFHNFKLSLRYLREFIHRSVPPFSLHDKFQFQKLFLRGVIPCPLQRLVHCKCFHRDSGNACKIQTII